MSSLSAVLVGGPVRTGRVVATGRLGCYLILAGTSADPAEVEAVLPVLTPAALALPTAVRLAEDAMPTLEVGDVASVGRGRIVGSGWALEIVRTFRPSQVRRQPTSRPARDSDMETMLATRLGLGPGLTPEGDDEIAGHLLVAAATGARCPELEPHLHRTTALSGSLLRAAVQGYAVPAVVAYVDAVLGNDDLTAARLRPTIEAIGHTSGPALLRGIHAAARLAEPRHPAPSRRHAGADLHERTVA